MRFLGCYEVQDLKLIREDLFSYLFPLEGQRFFSHFAEKNNQLILMVNGFSTGTVLPKKIGIV